MAAIDQTQGNRVLNAILTQTTGVNSTTGIKCRLGTNTPTASVAMTELTGTGYTAGGTVMTFSSASGLASSNTSTASWTNGSGSPWSIVGIELWDQAGSPLRWLFGTWTGQPISIANGNSFAVSTGGVAVSIS